jgi:hypothetical protein
MVSRLCGHVGAFADKYTAVVPAELSDDMISQGSFEEIPNLRRLIARKTRKSAKTRSDAQDLNYLGYRMPVARNPPEHHSSFIYSVSDGFEGREPEPMGKLMRVRQITRSRTPLVTILPRFGTLELVTEKKDDQIESRVKRQRDKLFVSEPQLGPEDDEDTVLLDALAPEEEASMRINLAQCVDTVEFEGGGKILSPKSSNRHQEWTCSCTSHIIVKKSNESFSLK